MSVTAAIATANWWFTKGRGVSLQVQPEITAPDTIPS
jgi:hypothetical protein